MFLEFKNVFFPLPTTPSEKFYFYDELLQRDHELEIARADRENLNRIHASAIISSSLTGIVIATTGITDGNVNFDHKAVKSFARWLQSNIKTKVFGEKAELEAH
jgi:hypothetical protein